MAINNYADPTQPIWYTNPDTGIKESRLQSNQTYVVTNNFLTLSGIPDNFSKVNVITIGGTTLYEVPIGTLLDSTKFSVDYSLGTIYFFGSIYNGQTANIASWFSRGIILYPSSRVYLTDSSNLYNSTNVEDFATEAFTHLNTTDGNLTAHQNSTTAHTTGNIVNTSNVTGAKDSDALNTLQGEINTLILASSNATIGVYSVTDSVNTNTYVATLTGITYFGGLKINLTVTNLNTSVATLNINSLGAKNIKIKKSDGTKVSLSGKEMQPISQLEYDGTDFILLNASVPEYSTPITSTASILSLPYNVMNKEALSLTLQGNTDQNFVTNGNFANGTTGWVAYTGSTDSVSNNILSNTANGTSASATERQVTNVKAFIGQKVYIKATIKVPTGCTNVSLYAYNGVNSRYAVNITPTVFNQFITYSGICSAMTEVGTLNLTVYIRHQYADATTANTQVMQVQQVMAIDLTTRFGAGNEPTQAQCDLRYANWFDGMKSVGSLRVTSVGKNLFDKSKIVYNNKISSANGLLVSVNDVCASDFINIIGNTAYKFNYGTSFINREIAFYDNKMIYISGLSGSSVLSFTSPINAKYVRLTISTIEIGNAQLEQCSTATTVEPYKSTVSYANLPHDMKSISSTVYDYYNINTGIDTKVCSDWVTLDGSLSWIQGSNYAGYKYTRIPITSLPNMYANKVNSLEVTDGTHLVLKYNNNILTAHALFSTYGADSYNYGSDSSYFDMTVSNSDSGFIDGVTPTSGEWKAYFYGWKMCDVAGAIYVSGTKYWKKITDGTGLTSTLPIASYTGYTPYKMIYQLATPVTTNYPPQILDAESNGTIYIENVIQGEEVYNGGITINNTTYPMVSTTATNSFAYVRKVITNSDNSISYTNVDLSTVTIAGNGLSFTSSALSNGDFVEYAYYYDSSLSVLPTSVYSYPINMSSVIQNAETQIVSLDNKINELNNFSVAMFLSLVGVPHLLNYQVEDLATNTGISARVLLSVPTGYTFTVQDISIISQGTASGIDASNTATINVTDGTNSIISKVYSNTTVFPASGVVDSLGTPSSTYKVLTVGEKIVLTVSYTGTTVNLPAMILQVTYTIIRNS